MARIESNSRTQNEVLGDLINLETDDELVFTAGRREVTVTGGGGSYNIEGMNRTYNGERVAARIIANLIR